MHRSSLRAIAGTIAALALLAVPASAQVGPHYVTSPNVQYVGPIKQVGDGVGARIIGERLFVTSTTGLSIFDISNAEAPAQLGVMTFDVEWENEDVPTNGKVLGISGSASASCGVGVTNCLNLYDVTNPAAPRLVKSVAGAGEHTSECVLDCTYFYGDGGTITDARDLANAAIVGSWKDEVEAQGVEFKGSTHATREIAPGLVLTATNPVLLLSLRPEEGGSAVKPVVLAQGGFEDSRLIHSVEWPRGGRDRWALIGEETNAHTQCDDQGAAYSTFDTKNIVNPAGGFFKGGTFLPTDDFRPSNGTYSDGKSPYNVLGCSVHWHDPHPTFHDGGLTAVAAYENGIRLLQVTPDGKLVEQGYYLPLGGSISAPHWHPNGKVFYAIDYTRGIDILRYTGDTYVPTSSGTVVPTPGTTPGTGGKGPSAPACASAAGFNNAEAKPSGKTVQFVVDRRESRPFTVDIFQQSAGSKVVKERLIRRFTNKTGNFVWDGKDRKKRRLASGNYFVRFTMKLQSGLRDVRRATLTRSGGKFKLAPDFYQRVDCGIFKSLKLASSVFGGRSKEKLRIAYKLEVPAKSVKLEVRAGSKLVRTINGGGKQGRTYRYSLPASIASKGQLVTVTATPDREGQATTTVKLTARRI